MPGTTMMWFGNKTDDKRIAIEGSLEIGDISTVIIFFIDLHKFIYMIYLWQ